MVKAMVVVKAQINIILDVDLKVVDLEKTQGRDMIESAP